jgi:hypothetical protein
LGTIPEFLTESAMGVYLSFKIRDRLGHPHVVTAIIGNDFRDRSNPYANGGTWEVRRPHFVAIVQQEKIRLLERLKQSLN